MSLRSSAINDPAEIERLTYNFEAGMEMILKREEIAVNCKPIGCAT